jgi:hypothetical protein
MVLDNDLLLASPSMFSDRLVDLQHLVRESRPLLLEFLCVVRISSSKCGPHGFSKVPVKIPSLFEQNRFERILCHGKHFFHGVSMRLLAVFIHIDLHDVRLSGLSFQGISVGRFLGMVGVRWGYFVLHLFLSILTELKLKQICDDPQRHSRTKDRSFLPVQGIEHL